MTTRSRPTGTPLRPALLIGTAASLGGVGLTVLFAFVFGVFSQTEPMMVQNLIAPRGLTPTADGKLLIAETGAGRILQVDPNDGMEVVHDGIPHTPADGLDNTAAGVASALRAGDSYYYVVGEAQAKGFSEVYRFTPGEQPGRITGQNVLGAIPPNPLTNPFDLLRLPNGDLLVSDSGVNKIFRVTESGHISTFAQFADRTLDRAQVDRAEDESGDHLKAGEENDPATFDVVPTGITFGPDGAIYVASLTGFPYPKGEAFVYRLEDRDDDGDAMDENEVEVFARGFSVATDLAFDEDSSLLVTEFSSDMHRLVTELQTTEAARLPGRLVRWRDGAIDVVREGLVSPTSVTVVDGRIFVSEEFAGRVVEIRPDGEDEPAGTALFLAVLAGFGGVVLALLVGWWAYGRLAGRGSV